jgi:menaquinone-dependent protoporphyrinogen IX oxidase
MPSRMLVAYVTAGGATEAYAKIIADALGARGHDADLVNLKRERAPDLSGYDGVVVGMGVRMAMVYRAGKRFLARKDLKGRPLAVYLSSAMAIDDPDKAKTKFLAPLMERYGLEPVMWDAFPGKMPGGPGKLEDRTDPEIARKWAEELAGRLDAQS